MSKFRIGIYQVTSEGVNRKSDVIKNVHLSEKLIDGCDIELLKRQIDFIPVAEINAPPGMAPPKPL